MVTEDATSLLDIQNETEVLYEKKVGYLNVIRDREHSTFLCDLTKT
jgi:hypothetical protein